jgi:membrane-associated phospholipid phosphatase
MKPSLLKAFATSIGLSALFIVVYGGCNWITAQRTNVGSINFAWERNIPFVPLMIAPYLSLDLFFVAAPFLCRSERELSLLTKRIAAAILIAGFCFLILPLRFAFARPHAIGWCGELFNWFRNLDAPFNQFPSLHIALCSILATVYLQQTRGIWRIAIAIWFVFVAASALLTYQHHLLDLLGGFVLGAGCLVGISSRQRARNSAPSRTAEIYELQRAHSALFRALKRAAGLLDALRRHRRRRARVFLATQTTGGDHDLDRLDFVRPFRLRKSRCNPSNGDASFRHTRCNQSSGRECA